MSKFNTDWLAYNTATKGYLFKEISTGTIFRPHELLCKFYEEDDESIEMLMKLNHPAYELQNVIGWTDGIITEPDLVFEKSV